MSEKQRLNVKEAAVYCGLSVGWMNKARMRDGVGPIFIKIGPRRVVYDIADLDLWLQANRRKSTLEARDAAKAIAA